VRPDLVYAAAGLAVAVLAAVSHRVTEHHVHLAWFWRYIRPGTIIPPVRAGTGWHSLSHGRQDRFRAAMLAAAGLFGTGFWLRPRIAVLAVLAVTVLWGTVLGARALARAFSGRHYHPDLEERDA
jgi:acetyltransferase-like isoleucine patch superfamily enzyme